MECLLLVSAQVSAEYESLATDIALERSLIVVHSQVVPQVAHFLKLGAAATVLADEQLLAAVRVEVDAHYFVVLTEGLDRFDLDVSVLCRVFIQKFNIQLFPLTVIVIICSCSVSD